MKTIIHRAISLALMLVLLCTLVAPVALAGPKVKTVTLSHASRTLGFDSVNNYFNLSVKKVKYTNGKTHNSLGYPDGLRFVCSNPALVTLRPLEGAVPGVRVTANERRAKGKVTVAAKIGNKTVARCTVKLVRIIKCTAISVTPSSVCLTEGDPPLALSVAAKPRNASALDLQSGMISWRSELESVATVSADGHVTAVGPGGTRIIYTLLDGSKKRGAIAVSVAASSQPQPTPTSAPVKPDGFVAITRMTARDMSISQGYAAHLVVRTEPANAYRGDIVYSSSDPSILRVDASNGDFYAEKTGTAVIRAFSPLSNLKCESTVTVTAHDPDHGDANAEDYLIDSTPRYPGDTYQTEGGSGGSYFFYGIANPLASGYDGTTPDWAAVTDLAKVRKLFEQASFGGQRIAFCTRSSMNGKDVLNMLTAMANNPRITESSTTYFYYVGHGGGSSAALICEDDLCVPIDLLQRYLDKVPGRIVVIADCCYAGTYIRPKSTGKSFAQSFIDAFSQRASVQGKGLSASPVANKYKVLVATQPQEQGWFVLDMENPDNGFNYFSYNLVRAINGAPFAADANRDGQITLHELYTGTVACLKAQEDLHQKPAEYRQTPMVWPENDSTVVYARN